MKRRIDYEEADDLCGGIYALVCEGGVYVGEAGIFRVRRREHRSVLNGGRGARKLQAAWDGFDGWRFVVLERYSDDARTLTRSEADWIAERGTLNSVI